MSIHLHIKKEDMTAAKDPELHSVPCKIYCDDTANVATYFKPYIKDIDDECKLFHLYFFASLKFSNSYLSYLMM